MQNSDGVDIYPNEPDTMTAALDRFARRGYRANFRASEGNIVCEECPEGHLPETLVVEDFRRFEGVSDPDDMSAVFALRCREHGIKGTFACAYGPSAGEEGGDMMQKLVLPPQ
jgi:hypothetical protein